MRWTVAVEVGEDGAPSSALGEGNVLQLRMDTDDVKRRIKHSTWELLDRFLIEETPPAAADLLRFAASVYSLDLRLPRASAGDRWCRDIELHLPVTQVEQWQAARKTAESLLRFLTGDVWRLNFHEGMQARPPFNDRLRKTTPLLDATAVCLLSGGMDSFIGAADALAAGEKLYLVSHTQGRYTTPPQNTVVEAFRDKFGSDGIRHIQFSLNPPTAKQLESCGMPITTETTMRSRSLVFFALGVLVASSIEGEQPLLVPENGLITINPPLVPSRTGSHSTRTTHPHTIRLLGQLLQELGISTKLVLDYKHKTKGEMLREATEREWVHGIATRTVSCGKSNSAAMKAARDGMEGVTHCGRCVPCIIRRAALKAAGISGERYAFDFEGEDVRAFRIAAARVRKRGFTFADLLASGPIPPDEVEAYLEVVRRGFEEVSTIF